MLGLIFFADGNHRSSVSTNRVLLAATTRQRQHDEPASVECDSLLLNMVARRGLRKHFGNWHTIYTRMNRGSKSGVLDRVFQDLQREQIVRIKIQAVSLDSTVMKVHPDGTGH